jgi:hypothetical protein
MTTTLWTAAQRLAQEFGFYGSVAVYRAGSLSHAAITIGVLIPGDVPSRETLADLGGGRASKLGSAASGTDILDGDELRATGHTWIVQGAENTPHILVMALSEERT